MQGVDQAEVHLALHPLAGAVRRILIVQALALTACGSPAPSDSVTEEDLPGICVDYTGDYEGCSLEEQEREQERERDAFVDAVIARDRCRAAGGDYAECALMYPLP